MQFLNWLEPEWSKLTPLQRKEFFQGYDAYTTEKVRDPVVSQLLEKVFEVEAVEKPKFFNEEVKVMAEKEKAIVPKGQDFALADLKSIAEDAWKSRSYSAIASKEQALVKILAGRELGIPPMTSISKVYVVQGRTAIEGEVMADLIKRSEKHDFRIIKTTATGCKLQFLKNGKPEDDDNKGIVEFNEEMARRAGLINKDNWRKYPEEMYYWKAIAKGARRYCPHIIHGAYTYDEMDMSLDQLGQTPQGAVTIKADKVVDAEVSPTHPVSAEPEKKEEPKQEAKPEPKPKGKKKKEKTEPEKEEPKTEPSQSDRPRSEIIAELKEKHKADGFAKMRKVKEDLKITGKIEDLSAEDFQRYVAELEK